MKTVVGLFDDPRHAHEAVQDLTNLGVPRDDISIVAREGDKVTTTTGDQTKTEAASGAGIGAATGAVAGGVAGAAGLLAALGLAAIPGIGPFLVAGPIVAALTGAGIGAVAGGLIGGLIGLGISDEDAEAYAEGVNRGGTLVTVTANDELTERIADVLERHHAVDIDRRAAEWQASGWQSKFDRSQEQGTLPTSSADRPSQRGTDRAATTHMRGEHAIPETEEQLNVGKRQVRSGSVRVYSRATERPVEANVNLREENVQVERRNVDRPATQEDMGRAFKEGAIEMTETREEPVVEKQARVTGEVVVRKDVNERTETVRDTVRKTEVEVDKQNQNQ